MKKVFMIVTMVFALCVSAFADKSRFYENGKVIDTMYVDSPEGLRVRSAPSLKSNRICGLTHRFPVKVVAIGKEEKIDGITAPWVEILIPRYEWKSDEPEYGWVFGGYLSKEQPEFDASNWTAADLKRWLTSKQWRMVVDYDDWGHVDFYENGSATIKGVYHTWTFNYQVQDGRTIKISNMSNTKIRSSIVQMPPYSEIYNQSYKVTIDDNLHINNRDSAFNLFYYLPAWVPELFSLRELYETDDYVWRSGNQYDYKIFKNYFEYYLEVEKSDLNEEYIKEFIRCGLDAKGTAYEQQYHAYWDPIMSEHQKKADEMK